MQIKFNNLESWSNDPLNLIFDCRSTSNFSNGFLSGSIFAGHNHFNFQHLSKIFTPSCKILIVIEGDGHEEIIREQLLSAGFKNIAGFLLFNEQECIANALTLDLIIGISADELALDIPYDENLMLVDVREAVEFEETHFSGSHSLPLSEMGDTANIAILPEEANLYIYCSDGERSLTAASILKRHGMHNLRVIEANWEELVNTKGLEIEKTNQPNLN